MFVLSICCLFGAVAVDPAAVEFLGEGAFTSLLGEWAEKANGTRIQLR